MKSGTNLTLLKCTSSSYKNYKKQTFADKFKTALFITIAKTSLGPKYSLVGDGELGIALVLISTQ